MTLRSELWSRARGVIMLLVATFFVTSVSTAASAAPTPGPVSSSAVGIGVVSVIPATGTDLDVLTLVTSGVCPKGGTNVLGTILGPGLPASGINVVPNSIAKVFARTAGGGLYLPSNNKLRNLADELPDPPVLKGAYQVRVECRGPSKIADLGDFYGSMTFDGHHRFTATDPHVPASSLATVGPPSTQPQPSAVGSEAPQRTATSAPPASEGPVRASTPVANGSTRGYGAWLVGAGIAMALAGLVVVVRGRRRSEPRGVGP